MYVLNIDWNRCEKKCIHVCHAVIDEFILRLEGNETFLIRDPDNAYNKYEMKLLRVECLCPEKAITFVKFHAVA